MSAGQQIESHLDFRKTNTQTETFSKMFTLRGADKELEKRKSIRRPRIQVDEAEELSESISSEDLSQSEEKQKSYFGKTFNQRTFRESSSSSKQSLMIPKEEPEQKLFPWERH